MKTASPKTTRLTVRAVSAFDAGQSAYPAQARTRDDGAFEKPTVSEYLDWRLHVLHSPDSKGDCSADVLPSRAEIRAILAGRRTH